MCPALLSIVRSIVASIRRNQLRDANAETLSHFERPGVLPSCWLVQTRSHRSGLPPSSARLVNFWFINDGKCVQFLVESGTLNSLSNSEAASACCLVGGSELLQVIITGSPRIERPQYCFRPQMEFVLRASRSLHDDVLAGCPCKLIITSVSSLNSMIGTIGRALLRHG